MCISQIRSQLGLALLLQCIAALTTWSRQSATWQPRLDWLPQIRPHMVAVLVSIYVLGPNVAAACATAFPCVRFHPEGGLLNLASILFVILSLT